ncbi:MAG: hypothetical protein TREMPRED_002331 [Tremellales sp. Tagirdzhanova-0007]|nr:MAG: hypothetical protein TREMPRED_002331 [Tremellales sp. Tagirdzhanova-0007]
MTALDLKTDTAADAVQTRTPFHALLPARPTLGLELAFSLPDAISRTLLLTQFSILPLLHPVPGSLSISPTSSSLILVPFILAVPFPALIFTGTSFLSPTPRLTTPAELRPWGWTAVDAWCPIMIPALFLSLIGPVEGWAWGLGMGEEEAVVLCMIVLWVIFAGRAVYNLGYKREHWTRLLRLEGGRKKIKTA